MKFFKKGYFLVVLLFLISCNHIETGQSLSPADVEYIRNLHLLDQNEEIIKFYSEFKIRTAGNFFSGKRIASYWIDSKEIKKSHLYSALYLDIISIDTVYHPGLTYSPFMLVTKSDGSAFKVSVNGKQEEIKAFFDDALQKWKSKSR